MEKWNKSWTLFLDRDGVINQRIPGAYVEYPSQFKFSENCLEAMAVFKEIFNRIVVVTNQQGIGKGIMTERQLADIHEFMKNAVESSEGKIDGIYHCSELEKNNPNCRKPNPEMAFQAKKDFPEIEFSKSVMVGDSLSDMEFGKRLNMTTVLIEGKEGEIFNDEIVDFRFSSLFDFARSI
jgi:histidinol-phosphate phosphatase family protein